MKLSTTFLLLVCYLKNLVHSGPMNHPLRTNKEKPLMNEIETGKDTEGRFIIWGKSESRKERERRTIPQMHPEQQPIFQEGLNGYQTQEQPCRNMLPPLMPGDRVDIQVDGGSPIIGSRMMEGSHPFVGQSGMFGQEPMDEIDVVIDEEFDDSYYAPSMGIFSPPTSDTVEIEIIADQDDLAMQSPNMDVIEVSVEGY